jgi:hypothetical protein
MSRSNLIELVEALREAGRLGHAENCEAHVIFDPNGSDELCTCGTTEHNAQVDAAAKALRAQIEANDSELVYTPCPKHGRTAYEIDICPDCDENGEIKVPRGTLT